MGIGILELLIIVGVVFLFLGPRKLPELAESIKKSRKILKEDNESEQECITEEGQNDDSAKK